MAPPWQDPRLRGDDALRISVIPANAGVQSRKQHSQLPASIPTGSPVYLNCNLDYYLPILNNRYSTMSIHAIDDSADALVQAPDLHDRHRGKRDALYFEAMKRVLDREMPGYAS